jgi:hypothetical protein
VIVQRIMLLVVTTHLNVCIQPTFAMFRQGELANLKKILRAARIDDKIFSLTTEARACAIHVVGV